MTRAMDLFNGAGNDYVLRIIDSGCYGGGWTFRLPSHGWCWFEFAVWYRGTH